MIIKRFFSGFVSVLPLINKNRKSVNYFPSEAFRSDWKNLERDLFKIQNKINKEK